MRTILLVFAALSLIAIGAAAAAAQIVISAHDGKQVRAGDAVPGPFADEVVTLRFGRDGPRVVGRVAAPATLNGPPVSVAVAPKTRFALVANAQRFGPDGKLAPYGIVSVIDLANPAVPKVVHNIEVGAGAMGVALNPGATLALVACAIDDSVAVLTIGPDRALTQIGSIKLEAKAEPRDVVIAPGGKSAYVVRFGDGKITELAINGRAVTKVRDIAVGMQPDGAIITLDGRYLYNTNFGGTPLSGKDGAISTVDLRTGQMIQAIAVGQTPEHVALSPDGKYLVSVVGNGSAFTRVTPNFATVVGRLRVYRAGGPMLEQLAEAEIGHNCQGAVFSDDGRQILVQCAVEKNITMFNFDGKTLVRGKNEPLVFDARPGAIATVNSR